MISSVLAMLALGCARPEPADCTEPYAGRHQFSADFESGAASLRRWFEDRVTRTEPRLGARAEGWGAHLVIRDEPVGRASAAGMSTRIEACRSIEIQVAARELAWGNPERLFPLMTHELQHTVVLSHLSVSDIDRVPLWVMEGLAVWGADQVELDLTKWIGNFVHEPWNLPDPVNWTLPSNDRAFRLVDYVMSGAVLSEVLTTPEHGRRLVAELAAGRDAEAVLTEMASSSLEDLVSRARGHVAKRVDERSRELDVEKLSLALSSGNVEDLESAYWARRAEPLSELLLVDLQRLACRRGPLPRCTRLTTELRDRSDQISVRALAGANAALARALMEEGQSREGVELGWDALRRSGGALTPSEMLELLRLLGALHALEGDGEGLLAVARVARSSVRNDARRQQVIGELFDHAMAAGLSTSEALLEADGPFVERSDTRFRQLPLPDAPPSNDAP